MGTPMNLTDEEFFEFVERLDNLETDFAELRQSMAKLEATAVEIVAHFHAPPIKTPAEIITFGNLTPEATQ